MNDGYPTDGEYGVSGVPPCGECDRGPDDAEPEKAQIDLLTIIFLTLAVFVVFVAVFETIALAVNAPEVFGFLSDKSFPIAVLVPSAQVLFYISGIELQIYWALLTVVILSCAATAVMKFIDAARSPGGLAGPGAVEGTAVFWVCILLSAYLFITIVVVSVLESAGDGITVPDFGTKVEQVFLFADAPVWEEIITRVMFIGVPMMLISFAVTRKKESLRCLLGGFGMSTTAVVLILISGVIFGLAHSSGWDGQAWKILTTAIMGIFLGYLFVRFGLYAAILMHFVLNYFQAFEWMGVAVLGDIAYQLLFGLGLISLIYILVNLVRSKEAIDSLPAFRNGYDK